MRHRELVRYCPGSASGSPALLKPDDADAQAVKDTRLIRTLEAINSIEKPVYYPHIGGYCPACKGSHKAGEKS